MMKNQSYLITKNEQDCCGCAACAYACPAGCITMVEDSLGFQIPLVDEISCINCGLCFKRCPMTKVENLKSKNHLECYGAYSLDRNSLVNSSSGGISFLLGQHALEHGYVVYACTSNRENVRHVRIDTTDELRKTQGSKYVQSDIRQIYSQIKADLDDGRHILFVGLPCQCAALKSSFQSDENLLLVDLVCEGVPNRRMYCEFLDALEAETGQRVMDFRFRDKRSGWSKNNPVVVGGNGEPVKKQHYSYYYYYYYLFIHGLILRNSCYACPFACPERVGDITLGDYWGVESTNLGYTSAEIMGGISSVIVNSEKGLEVMKSVSEFADMRPCSFMSIAQSNNCLNRPTSVDRSARKAVELAYLESGVEGLITQYSKLFTGVSHLLAAVSARVPYKIKIIAKRIANKHV